MDISKQELAQALRRTQKDYSITAKELASATGLSESAISDIRNAKVDPHWSSIYKLMNAMDSFRPGARAYFCKQLSGLGSSGRRPDFESMDEDELADCMVAIGQAWKKIRKSSDASDLLKVG